MQYNPIEVSNNLKKNGGFVPGFRPGKPTSDFLSKVVSRITMFGALYLAVVALLPTIVGNIMLLAGSSAGRSLAIVLPRRHMLSAIVGRLAPPAR